ncbi:MAG TPA: EAL domain-containing protein [Burkholderiales bacterium]|nr:EAL domain-containing protein [Burkholderiales bacterium]
MDVLFLVVFACGVVYLAMHLRSRRAARALAEVRRSERRFRDLTELSADWFWETDASQRITWISGGTPVATFFGGIPTYGKRFWEIPGVQVESRVLDALHEGMEERRPFFDLEMMRVDERGARQIHIISGQSRKDAEGRFLGYRGVGRDVTEQRRAERALAEAKERLELAVGAANLAEWDYDLESNAIYLGSGWAGLLGRRPIAGVMSGADVNGLVHPDDRPAVRSELVAGLKGEKSICQVDCRVRTEDGGWRWVRAKGRVTERNDLGRATRASGTVSDIEDHKRAEEALAEREQRFRDMAEASGEYLWEADASWCYTFLSERVEAVLGYRPQDLLGRGAQEIMPLGEERAVQAWLAEHAPAGRAFRELVHRVVTRAHGVIWQAVSAVPVRDATGAFAGYRGTAADITPRRQAEARAEYLATRDALTGLPNRVLLADRGAQAILQAARGRTQLALLLIDIDRFKLVNESLGHQAGDTLLREVGARLESLMPSDTLARLGGDDFVLLHAVRNVEEAAGLAQRILGVLARPFSVEGRTLNVGASIGISVYPSDARDFAELLRNADTAKYHAKETGRGTWRMYEPALHARSVERLRLENELHGALARSELVLHWQPVVRGRRLVVGAEALVRWHHPDRGLLLPDEFVPLAEECGLIRPIGEWTFERALSQAGAWQRAHPGRCWIAVNVSAPELAQNDAYLERVKAALRANAVEPSSLELEVTERVLMSSLEENIETLRRLGELGVRISIDDFGTGYSSLAYLRQLPVHKLKIDRSFLRSIDTHAADEAIVRAIAVLAKTLGVAVAAEGIENEAQLSRLLALGCDEWQGHYFSPPLDASGFEKLLAAESSAKAAG